MHQAPINTHTIIPKAPRNVYVQVKAAVSFNCPYPLFIYHIAQDHTKPSKKAQKKAKDLDPLLA
jgi:hypothetical protein